MATVMIVDDEETTRLTMARLMTLAGHQTVTAGSGPEALDKLHRNDDKPSLVLLDLCMPDMDGFEVLQAVKRDPDLCDVPVMIVSALGDERSVRRAHELGAADYLVKASFSWRDLLDRLRKHMPA